MGGWCVDGVLPPAFKLFQTMIHTYSDRATIKIKNCNTYGLNYKLYLFKFYIDLA